MNNVLFKEYRYRKVKVDPRLMACCRLKISCYDMSELVSVHVHQAAHDYQEAEMLPEPLLQKFTFNKRIVKSPIHQGYNQTFWHECHCNQLSGSLS